MMGMDGGFLIFLFFYLILIIMVTAIGRSRHRGADGFFASLLFSPVVGLIWVLAMPDPTDVICPICKELVKKEALKCKHCGADLNK